MIYYTYQGASCYKFQNNFVFLSELCIFVRRSFFFTLTNNVDSDEMLNIWVFTVCKRWQLVRLPELLLCPSGPSSIKRSWQAWLSLDIILKRDKMGLSARLSECLNGCFHEHTSSDFIQLLVHSCPLIHFCTRHLKVRGIMVYPPFRNSS